MNDLKWEPLASRRRVLRLTLLFQGLHDLVAIPTDSILTKADSRNRSPKQENFKLFPAKTDQYKFSFYPRTVKEWNDLPSSVIDCDNVDTFHAPLGLTCQRYNSPLARILLRRFLLIIPADTDQHFTTD